MRLIGPILLVLSSCSTTISNQDIINSANISLVRLSNEYSESVYRTFVYELIAISDKYEDCNEVNEYINNVNLLHCYIGGFSLIINKCNDLEFSVWLSIMNELSNNIIRKRDAVFHGDPPRQIIGLTELIRRYIDNNNIELISANISCENVQLMPLMDCEF